MKLLSWIAGAVTALVLVLFAVSNRAPVTFGFEPFPFTLELPLYGGIFASLVLGFILGGIGAWIGGRRSRRRARQAEAEVKRLKAELAAAGQAAAASGPVPTAKDPAARAAALPSPPGGG